MNLNQVVYNIQEYIDKWGGEYTEWYVGITEDVEQRLFIVHQVDKDNGYWIYVPTQSCAIARGVEQYFITELGADGGTGGGDDNTTIVYAYKKDYSTNP